VTGPEWAAGAAGEAEPPPHAESRAAEVRTAALKVTLLQCVNFTSLSFEVVRNVGKGRAPHALRLG